MTTEPIWVRYVIMYENTFELIQKTNISCEDYKFTLRTLLYLINIHVTHPVY